MQLRDYWRRECADSNGVIGFPTNYYRKLSKPVAPESASCTYILPPYRRNARTDIGNYGYFRIDINVRIISLIIDFIYLSAFPCSNNDSRHFNVIIIDRFDSCIIRLQSALFYKIHAISYCDPFDNGNPRNCKIHLIYNELLLETSLWISNFEYLIISWYCL